jgi:hypothetical protein
LPTVIDELIVKLGLDPTDFNTEEAKLAQSLRRMEEGARRGSQRLNDEVGRDTVQFFRSLNTPVAGLRRLFEELVTTVEAPKRQLQQLEDQGRRTGESVEGGALAGARGLRVLGAAGLGVFAAYEALSKTISAANSGAERLFGTGIGASSAGLGIGQFTAISQALLRGGNVPLVQSQATLGELRGAQVGYGQAGPGGDAARARLIALNTGLVGLGITGVDVWHDTPEQILGKLSAAFAGMPESQFNPGNISQQTGIPVEEVYGLRRVGSQPGGLGAATEAERARQATLGQQDAAAGLVTATGNLSNAFDHLGRVLGAIVDGPLERLENALAWLVDKFAEGEDSTTDTARYAQETGDTSTQGAWPSWQRFKWNVRNSPVGRMLGLGTGDAAPGGGSTGDAAPGGGSTGDAAPGGGSPRASSSSFAPTTGTDVEMASAAVRAAGGNDYAVAGALAAMNAESGMNPGLVAGGGDTSWAQWTQGRKQRLYALGWRPGDPVAQRKAAASLLHEELAANPALVARMNASGSATAAAKMFGFTFEQGGAPAGVFGGGGHDQAFMDSFHSAHAEDYLRAIQASQAVGNTSSSTTNHGDMNLTVNNTVHAPMREGSAIADAVADRIRRVGLATTSNLGLTE